MIYFVNRVVGVPKEEQFPKDCIIPLDQFPNYPPQPMSQVIPDVSDLGIDLFRVSQCNSVQVFHAFFVNTSFRL